jgi:FixJ family two-component response regulator
MQELATSEIIVKIQRGQIMRKMEASSLAGFVRMAEKFGAAG